MLLFLYASGFLVAASSASGIDAQAAPTAEQGTAAKPSATQPPAVRTLAFRTARWTGDFDKMLERRAVRIAVPYSRSLYFNDKGHERGLTAELVRDFERYLNRKYRKKLGNRPLTVAIIAATRDQLFTMVADGYADLAAGNLTVTEDRLKLVDMLADENPMPEIVVTGPRSPPIADVDSLSGMTVHVRRSSSYYESLTALNERFRRAGKREVQLALLPDALEDEDLMEMVNVGVLQAIVVDLWKAQLWLPMLPNLTIHDDVVLRADGYRGWAFRKESPRLRAEVSQFYTSWVKKQSLVAVRLQNFMKRVKSMKDPTASDDWKRFQDVAALFEKYGNQYKFDPLMLTAQGYQESRLDHDARSTVGAVGIMQIMPATGKEMNVGDIASIEHNVHAAAKYMDHLLTRYFAGAHFTEQDRTLFAFASYNCGPGNVARARRDAQKLGLDPNVWFNNVEITIAKRVGIETTTYVRNIFKYYVTYRMIAEAQQRSEKARELVAPERN